VTGLNDFWTIVFFGQFSDNYGSRHKILADLLNGEINVCFGQKMGWGTFSTVKENVHMYILILTKKMVGLHVGDFSPKSSGHSVSADRFRAFIFPPNSTAMKNNLKSRFSEIPKNVIFSLTKPPEEDPVQG
jgi:hypothetical protein